MRHTEQSFWALVDRRGARECWPWRGRSRHGFGYGKLSYQGRHRLAHQVAWTLYNGPLPPGSVVRHTCDNPSCCNPAHLLLGTQADNVADCVARGRSRSPRGGANAMAKLTEAHIAYIRSNPDNLSQAGLAARLGVSQPTVCEAATGKTWGHVDAPTRRCDAGLVHFNSRLTAEDVRRIRDAPSSISSRRLAQELGCSPSAVSRIRAGLAHRSVP